MIDKKGTKLAQSERHDSPEISSAATVKVKR